MKTNHDYLLEASRRILENDEEIAAMAKNVRRDKDLTRTVNEVRSALLPLARVAPAKAAGGLESMEAATADFGLETIVQRLGRPVLLVQKGKYYITDKRLEQPDADIWKKRLFKPAVKKKLESVIPSVGRVDLLNNMDFEWVGTGWVADKNIVVTNRHVAEVFAAAKGDGRFTFKPGYPGGQMAANLDFLQEHDRAETHLLSVKDVLYISPQGEPDVAFLKVEKIKGSKAELAVPFVFAKTKPKEKQFVATIGYPAYDSRVPDADLIEKFFGDIFNKKRFAPGQIIGNEDGEIHHDCSTLGGNSGSPVFDLETGEVLGLHYSGLFLRRNQAVSGHIVLGLLQKVKKSSNGSFASSTALADGTPAAHSAGPATRAVPGPDGIVDFNVPIRIQITVDQNGGPPAFVAQASAFSETPVQVALAERRAAAPVLTYEEFIQMVDDPATTDADLAPYFVEDESLSCRLDPGFRLNPGLVQIDTQMAVPESALLLNSANWIYKKKRQQRYLQQIKDGTKRIRIVAEGDSWFQYPVMLYDIIDHLMDRPELAIFCCSEAGDVLSNMLPKGEFYVPLQRENASVFLFSGSGNDLVDGMGLRRFLRKLPAGRPAKDHFTPAYRAFMDNIRGQYETLFTRVLRHQPGVHIICHGYSDAIPQPAKGKWLGRPMSEIGITDLELQKAIVRIILKDLNELLADVAAKFGKNRVTYVDLRGIVPANGWHDEFHPTSDYFGKVAAPIYKEILKHS